MKIDSCRVCGNEFFDKPLLKYKNVPSTAQNLPDENSLKSDKGIDLEVYQCSGCGLVQLDNEPVPYYKEVIRAAGFSDEMKRFRLKQFEEFVENYSLRRRKIIEIGCGNGEYLSIMKQTGAEAYGLEQAVDSVQQCIRKGLKVSQGFIESGNDKIEAAPFDAFFILNFLEHLPNPNASLRGIHNNLTYNAAGIIEVPNFDKILQNNLFSEFIRDHLLYFNKDTLRTTLELNGYEIIKCSDERDGYIISAIAKKREMISLACFYESQEKLKEEIKRYIGRFDNRKVAIWGAGHQALSAISLMDLGKDIRYVIDSAPFKQGKYTPVSHVPIMPPEIINSDPIKAVIVMVGSSYSDEVVKTIQKKYGNKIDIAVLRDFGLEEIKK